MNNGRICVVLVVDDLGFGGAESQVVELANNMDTTRFDIHVCSLSDHVPLGKELQNAEHRLHIIKKMHRFDFTIVPRLAYLLRALRTDIVHGYLFGAEITGRLAGRLASIKLVVGSERNANRVIRKSSIWAYRLTQRCADVIVANSNTGAESNAKILKRPSSDYRVVHNGVNTTRYRPTNGKTTRLELGIPQQCPVIGAFANFKKQKNHAMLFRAFKLVLESLPEVRLLLIGERPVDSRGRLDTYKAQLDRLVDDLKIRHRCLFLGHRKDTEHLFPVCDITVLSSFHEGTPNVLLESMACGIPVVATNVCDNEYIVKEGETGHLVAVGEVAQMAQRMESLLGDDILRWEMGGNARKWVMGEFSTERLVSKMEALYEDLLDQKLGSGSP